MSTDNLLALKDDMVAFIEGHGLQTPPRLRHRGHPLHRMGGPGQPRRMERLCGDGQARRRSLRHLQRNDAGARGARRADRGSRRDELPRRRGHRTGRGASGCASTPAIWATSSSAFVYQGVAFLHETTTEWYERFQALLEDIETFQDIVIDDAHTSTKTTRTSNPVECLRPKSIPGPDL
jgi:hypothetical protein